MSSSLQVGLAIAGGVVLVGVVGYNAWQSRKNTPRKAKPSSPLTPLAQHETAEEPAVGARVGASPSFIEPALGELMPPVAASSAGEHGLPPSNSAGDGAATGHSLVEPTLDSVVPTLTPIPTPTLATPTFSAAERAPTLDALIDVIGTLQLEHPTYTEAISSHLPKTRRAGGKPFAIEGFNVDTSAWEPLLPGQRYDRLQFGVLMANRNGALNQIEFSELVMHAQGVADALSATAEFPDMVESVARARELDQFASAHDAHLSFYLRAKGPAWSPGFIQQQAAQHGFVAGALPGRLVLPCSVAGLPPVLTLTFDTQAALAQEPDESAVRECVLSLEVPLVDRAEQPFVRLRELSRALAQAMGGVVTDQGGHPISDESMDAIGADLEQLYDALDSRDLAAGSALARRVFN